MFLDQFASYFTLEQRQTELYKIWSAIGVNMEKAFLEEQNRLNSSMTDINTFDEDTLRSWLSFFLVKIPYRISPTTSVSVTMESDNSPTNIPKYSQIKTDKGIIYTTLEDMTISSQGETMTSLAVQGTRIVEQGTYSSMIKVQASNPDMTYLTVSIGENVNGEIVYTDIPEVSFTSSYDYLSYSRSWTPVSSEDGGNPKLSNDTGIKGQWFNVIQSGETKFSDTTLPIKFKQGDIVIFDGETWQKLLDVNRLNPLQYCNNYAVPSNGYYAYYYNGFLYIKIFSGTNVVNPEGKPFTITYIRSDGIQGEIKENELTSFIDSFKDQDENTPIFSIKNIASSGGVNQPSTGKLGLILKQRLYCGITISSVPEYTAWFRAQPEVGDCKVVSDWEKYLYNTGSVFVPTGQVDVYLCDNSGQKLSTAVKEELSLRIEPYKDIAYLNIIDFKEIKHALKFTYASSTSEELFEEYVKTQAQLFYNVTYLQSDKNSVFNDLDLSYVIQNILNNSPYITSGLVVNGYHYFDDEIPSNKHWVRNNFYDGEKVGDGEYVLTVTDQQNNQTIYNFKEGLPPGQVGVANVYDVTDSSKIVGQRSLNEEDLDFTLYIPDGSTATIKCFWGMENPGILTVGSQDGLRSLNSSNVFVSRSGS